MMSGHLENEIGDMWAMGAKTSQCGTIAMFYGVQEIEYINIAKGTTDPGYWVGISSLFSHWVAPLA